MKRSALFFLVFFFYGLLYSQQSLSRFLTVKVVDSLQGANGWGIVGYKSLHLQTDNNGTVYLSAKKIWHQDGIDTATIALGTRLNGQWSFRDVLTPHEKIYASPVKMTLNNQHLPLIFFKDRLPVNGWLKHSAIQVLNIENSEVVLSTAEIYENDVTKREMFNAFGAVNNPGFVFVDLYWSDALQRRYFAYSVYDFTTNNSQTVVSYNLDSVAIYTDDFTIPTPTRDGEYFVHSVVAYTDKENMYQAELLVYKKVAPDSWTLDFQYVSDTLFSFYPHDLAFNHVIGKAPDGSIFLIAVNSFERMFLIKSNGAWTKVTDQFPIANGYESEGMTTRPLDNESIRFASDGTAFWGDIDGGSTYSFGAEINFRTTDDHWGRIYCPPAPGYNSDGGQFWHHDFTITPDDSLLIVYEFAPYDAGLQKIYLLEARAAVQDIVNYVTALKGDASVQLPEKVKLLQNYPNPFNPVTTIDFELSETSPVLLQIFNASGELVSTLFEGRLGPGKHSATFDGSSFSSGVYFYRLKTSNHLLTKKMILLR